MGEVHGDTRTRGTERVAEGDGTSIDVENGLVEAQLLGAREDLSQVSSVGQSVGLSVGRSVGLGQSVGRSVGRSVGQNP